MNLFKKKKDKVAKTAANQMLLNQDFYSKNNFKSEPNNKFNNKYNNKFNINKFDDKSDNKFVKKVR